MNREQLLTHLRLCGWELYGDTNCDPKALDYWCLIRGGVILFRSCYTNMDRHASWDEDVLAISGTRFQPGEDVPEALLRGWVDYLQEQGL